MNCRILAFGVGLFIAFFGVVASGQTECRTPHHVGVKIYHWDNGERIVPVIVWYPAKVEPGAVGFDYYGSVKGEAVYDAAPDSACGPYPLILFSHGMGGCGNQSVFYTENLASQGYVVVAPDHADSAMCHIDGGKDIGAGKIVLAYLKSGGDLGKSVLNLFKDRAEVLRDPSYRPAEVSFVADKVLELSRGQEKPVSGMVDGSLIGMSGHSFGGWTSLAIAGSEIVCTDPETYSEESCSYLSCLDPETFDKEMCEFKMDQPITPLVCCGEEYRGKSVSMRDTRVKAILPLGPASMLFPNYDGISKIDIPVMFISGSAEFEVDWDQNVAQVYDRLSAPRYALKLKKVDHMTVSDVTYSVPGAALFLRGFWNYKAKKEIYERYSEAFFNAYLKDDPEALRYIQNSHHKLVELAKDAP
jgi:predicted dienelactone hydrolase